MHISLNVNAFYSNRDGDIDKRYKIVLINVQIGFT